MARGFRATAGFGMALLLLLGSAGRAAEAGSPERVKATFLYHLTGYVTWPADAFSSGTDPVAIVVVGDSALADAVVAVTAGQQTQGRALAVHKVAAGEPLPRAHLVLLPAGDYQALKEYAATLRDRPTLRVAESERFAEAIGDVGFTLVGGRVSFEINRHNTRRNGLKVSSKLMKLASNIE
jgi:YfiR/HmsC-like